MEMQEKFDWVNLPKDVEPISLWRCLHDGELISCTSNLLDCEVMLEFSVKYLLKETNILLRLNNVSSVRANILTRWVGGFQEPINASNEEREILIKEYQAKWREESINWSEFELILTNDPLEISDASLILRENELALNLNGFLNGEKFDDIFCSVFLRAKQMTVDRADGAKFSFEDFITLGKNYWDSFGTK